MEFIPNEKGFIIKSDSMIQNYSWSIYDTGEIIYPEQTIQLKEKIEYKNNTRI